MTARAVGQAVAAISSGSTHSSSGPGAQLEGENCLDFGTQSIAAGAVAVQSCSAEGCFGVLTKALVEEEASRNHAAWAAGLVVVVSERWVVAFAAD